MAVNSYKITPLAEADLEEIWLYTFRNWSQKQADNYHGNLVNSFADLAAGTKFGRNVDIRVGYKKYAVASHVIYYREDNGSIIITRILHGSMDVVRHL